MLRWIAVSLLAGIVLAVAGAACSSNKNTSTKATTPTATKIVATSTTASAPTDTPLPALTTTPPTVSESPPGIGATREEWESRHVEVTTNLPCAVITYCLHRFYDQQRGGTDRYEVSPLDHDRIILLTVRPRPNVSRDAAVEEARRLLPPDAQLAATDEVTVECEQLGFASATLAAVFRQGGVTGDGRVSVALYTIGLNDQTMPFNPQQVDELILTSLTPSGDYVSTC